MAGKIVFFVCCLMCAIPFVIISGYDQGATTPVPFWSGSEAKLKKELKDIKSYNEEMRKLYKKGAVAFVLCGAVGMIHIMIGLIASGCVCTIGFCYFFNQYRKIKKKYAL